MVNLIPPFGEDPQYGNNSGKRLFPGVCFFVLYPVMQCSHTRKIPGTEAAAPGDYMSCQLYLQIQLFKSAL